MATPARRRARGQILKVLIGHLKSRLSGARFEPADDHDTALRAGLARDQVSVNIPIFRCSGQFTLYILSLGKQTLCTRFQKRLRELQQFI
jgi:hypothetical protein